MENNLLTIAETISLDYKTPSINPEYIMPYLKTAVNKLCILIDARYGSKGEKIRLVESALSDLESPPPFFISLVQWNQLYSEARQVVDKIKKGKLVQPLELIDSVSDFYRNGYDAGKKFPTWYNFSDHYRVAKGELTIVTGIPGHGKSEFMDAMAVELAIAYNWRFAVFSPENFPYAIHCEKILSKLTGKPFHPGYTARMEAHEVTEKMNWIHDHFIFIEPSDDALHLDAVIGLAAQAIEEYKIDGVIIDPWNEIEHDRPGGKSETDYIGEGLMKCRRFARRNNIALWIIAHPSKQYRDKETGEYHIPSPYDISGSAHWRNKADNCLCIFRGSNNEVTVHVQKIKFKIRGQLGGIEFYYDKISGRYTEKEVEKNTIPGVMND